MQLEPGAILASPQGRGTITIVSTEPALLALLDEHLYTWRLDTALITFRRMEFAVVGQEDAEVLDQRVRRAEVAYQMRAIGQVAA